MRSNESSLVMQSRAKTIVWLTLATAVMVFMTFINVSCGSSDSATESLESPQQTLVEAATRMAALTFLAFVLSHAHAWAA